MNLQIQHVKKEFNHTMALADVTFAVSQGEFVSVIGPSGAGKTTLFRILNGMLPCTSGQILLDGIPFHTLHGRQPLLPFITIFVLWRNPPAWKMCSPPAFRTLDFSPVCWGFMEKIVKRKPGSFWTG